MRENWRLLLKLLADKPVGHIWVYSVFGQKL